ncbi:hypothetical protein JM47_00335 [Ureaplasma diversum]|uniref:Flavoprotein n=1 Tax=Ureaplasma diversum TaxID=42094 RepID=A0A0C5S166_9BACT|nr:aminoacetone oxidase family FAD-binding enzyme [Ureaplasma diversum]AJQ45115.1 hypothetical protein JM47_00335 [Ureaplasma diversum]
MKQFVYDLIIIGAGPSGVYSAIHATDNAKVLLIDKNKEIMKKFIQTGAGHCNITNNIALDQLVDNMLYSKKFMYSAFSLYGPKQILEFCAKHRIDTYQVENSTKIKITCNNTTFIKKMNQIIESKDNIDLKLDCAIKSVHIVDDLYVIKDQNNELYYSKALMIATGGLSYPRTGSTGDGYKFALSLNHTLLRTYPMGLGIVINDQFKITSNLQGTPFSNVIGSIIDCETNKVLVSEKGELMIAHFGMGGTLIRRLSGYVSYHNQSKLKLRLAWLSEQAVLDELKQHKTLKKCFSALPNKFIEFIYQLSNLSFDQQTANLSKAQTKLLIKYLTNFEFEVVGVNNPDLAISTGGGVNFAELNPKSMESKYHPNLYFIGEVVGVSPKTGGFNLSVCYATALAAITHFNNNFSKEKEIE